MDLLQALLLALVQGITEFLPISSSAHLILPAQILGWDDQGLAFDVAVHLGSLLAVLTALRQDVTRMVAGALRALVERRMNPDFRLGLLVVLATVPVVLAGFALKDLVETGLRSVGVIATTTILFGLLLWFADTRAHRRAPRAIDTDANTAVEGGRQEQDLGVRDALVIGVAQCIALVPGTSRSGITMTAGLLLGLSRTACARFSFLLAIPTIAGAAVLSTGDLLSSDVAVDWWGLGVGFAAAALAAWACIHFFLALVDRVGFLPFVLYRLALGLVLFAFFL